MSLKDRSSRHCSQFTSPLHASSTSKREKSKEDLMAHLDELNKEISMLIEEGLREEELKVHIEKLHEYNRLKDVGQAVLGQLDSPATGFPPSFFNQWVDNHKSMWDEQIHQEYIDAPVL